MRRGVLGFAAALTLLAGCAPNPVGTAPPTQTLVPSTATVAPSPARATATPPLPGPADVVRTATAVAISAQAQVLVGLVIADLAATLDVPAETIQVRAIEAVAWSDVSLGCGHIEPPDDTMHIDGYRITLDHEGDTYEYHTDSDSQFRACQPDEESAGSGEPVILDPIINSLVELARRHLAERLDLPLRRVFLVAVTSYQWPDSSLGCPQTEQDYAPTPTLGYRIVLRVGRQRYYYHSNYRQVLPCPEEAEQLPDLNPTPENTITPTNSE